ncbi:MAG: hypothetical protein POELPBGB_03387 [Bacteroidia bacterium]|nr:hypothetical protein [Bacteroidia bacterium]
MKTKFFLLLLMISGMYLTSTAQVTLNGVTLPAKLKQGNTELLLNGGGIRTKIFFKIYTAGLYLPAKSKNGNEIAAADKPTAMRLTITSGMVDSEKMSEAMREGFGKSMKGNTAPLKTQIDNFVSTFQKEELKEGDMFELWYIPGTGVQAYKNGKLQTTVAGLDFKKALFGIWLSDDPVDSDLKEGLLGL